MTLFKNYDFKEKGENVSFVTFTQKLIHIF